MKNVRWKLYNTALRTSETSEMMWENFNEILQVLGREFMGNFCVKFKRIVTVRIFAGILYAYELWLKINSNTVNGNPKYIIRRNSKPLINNNCKLNNAYCIVQSVEKLHNLCIRSRFLQRENYCKENTLRNERYGLTAT